MFDKKGFVRKTEVTVLKRKLAPISALADKLHKVSAVFKEFDELFEEYGVATKRARRGPSPLVGVCTPTFFTE